MNDIFYNATEIQSMVRNMDDTKKKYKSLKQTNYEEYQKKLQEENQILHFNYPSIFTLHAEDKLDATFFYMLNMKRRVERGELTEDDASKEVGQRLYNRWVAPVIDPSAQRRPAEESYEDYYKKVTNK